MYILALRRDCVYADFVLVSERRHVVLGQAGIIDVFPDYERVAGLLMFGRLINIWQDYSCLVGLMNLCQAYERFAGSLTFGRIVNVWQD